MTQLVIEPVTKIEGHAKLVVDVEDNIVKKARLFSAVPIRGFETFAVGKGIKLLPNVVMRICGICPAAHAISASVAVEKAIGLQVPEDGLILRTIVGLANRIQSHVLAYYFTYDDFIGVKEKRKQLIDMFVQASKVLHISGLSNIHPPNIVVGGMRDNLSERGKKQILESLKIYREGAEEQKVLFEEMVDKKVSEGEIPQGLGEHNRRRFATDFSYGKENFDPFSIQLVPPEKWYTMEEIDRFKSNMLALWEGEPLEVGVRARMEKFYRFKGKGTLDIIRARLEEMIKTVDVMMDLLESLNLKGNVFEQPVPSEGTGIGVHEAPRGISIHRVEIRRDGTVMGYKIIVPTMFNIPIIEEVIQGRELKWAEPLVRAYDPCTSCATHTLELQVINSGGNAKHDKDEKEVRE